jgi:predicted enzyme related to lactoylglutathione lyase
MAVTRIVANLPAPDPMGLARFYREVFELDLPFEMGWIAFLSKDSTQKIELHAASEGGSGTELPMISIGVDNLDATEAAVRAAGAEVVYGPTSEEWGLRRFFFRDPAGNLVNVVDH